VLIATPHGVACSGIAITARHELLRAAVILHAARDA